MLGLCALALVGCTKTVTKEVPVVVKVPVAQACPSATIRTVARPAKPAIALIDASTPIDKDVDYWKAWVMQLLAYAEGLETANADLSSALKVCMGHET